MPRVPIKKKDYKLVDFKLWVKTKMELNHMKQEDVGKALGLSQERISQMLKIPDKKKKNEKINPDPFSYGQVLTLCEFFEADEDEKARLLTM